MSGPGQGSKARKPAGAADAAANAANAERRGGLQEGGGRCTDGRGQARRWVVGEPAGAADAAANAAATAERRSGLREGGGPSAL